MRSESRKQFIILEPVRTQGQWFRVSGAPAMSELDKVVTVVFPRTFYSRVCTVASSKRSIVPFQIQVHRHFPTLHLY